MQIRNLKKLSEEAQRFILKNSHCKWVIKSWGTITVTFNGHTEEFPDESFFSQAWEECTELNLKGI